MKVFSPAFQGTALTKDVKTVLPCRYSRDRLSPNRKQRRQCGEDYFWFPEDGPGVLRANWALFQT